MPPRPRLVTSLAIACIGLVLLGCVLGLAMLWLLTATWGSPGESG